MESLPSDDYVPKNISTMDRIKHIIAKSRITTVITIVLTIVDMVSDYLLAMYYTETGQDYWWATLTWTFFILPLLPLPILLVFTLYAMLKYGWEGFTECNLDFFYGSWKQFECVAESGPQLILQFYIMAISTYNIDDGSDHTSNSENTTPLRIGILKSENSTVLLWITQSDNATITSTVLDNMSDNMTGSLELNNNREDTWTLMWQIFVIISALFSISWTATSFNIRTEAHFADMFVGRAHDEHKTTDIIAEMVWNMLCISSRVIVLALFASVERYWFAGLVTLQVIVIAAMYGNVCKDCSCHCLGCPGVIFPTMLGIHSLFNIFLTNDFDGQIRYVFYVMYWIVTMIENVLFIWTWYSATDGYKLWYHDAAVLYIITAYFAAFLLKTLSWRHKKYK